MNLNRNEVRSAIIGMVLGDGSISHRVGRKEASYQMTHCEKQYDYLLWKQQILNKITSSSVQNTKRVIDDKIFKGYHLGTRQHPMFTKLYNRFYYKKIKVVDEYLVKHITPLAFAIWYMDDGCFGNANRKNDSFFLCTQNFDYSNQLLLKKSLKLKYNLDWNLNKAEKAKDGSYHYRLRLANRCNDEFISIIAPFVITSMRYKLGLYANTLNKNI